MMRACIVYSSRTGNTRLVGEHLAESLRLPLFSVEEAPLSGYDTYILGFWTWRGGPDAAMAAFMNRLPGRNVFFFGTMVAEPDSLHAARCAERTRKLLEKGRCRVLGYFFCQGRLDERQLEKSAHPRTPERMARIRRAALHPDMQDFRRAEQCVRETCFPTRKPLSGGENSLSSFPRGLRDGKA
ncbi:flavodoxin family protein [Mailhella massiliensis]|uniref:flavodoxin family protein n=1 Tax=Mailhella massiliensis TaxID=1903261 RepID=UPI001EF609A6|nr:flavodoxin family protein [Mailhella massiliensis]